MTDWEPATEAETAMRNALRTADQELYFRILARTELLLPVSPEALAGRAPMGWGTWNSGGRTHVLAFTSNEAMRICLAEHAGSARKVAYHELAAAWPNQDWWLAVNPGMPIEGYLPPWFVGQLARGDVRVPSRSPSGEQHYDDSSSNGGGPAAATFTRSARSQPQFPRGTAAAGARREATRASAPRDAFTPMPPPPPEEPIEAEMIDAEPEDAPPAGAHSSGRSAPARGRPGPSSRRPRRHDATIIDAEIIESTVLGASALQAMVVNATVIDASKIDSDVIDATLVDMLVEDTLPRAGRIVRRRLTAGPSSSTSDGNGQPSGPTTDSGVAQPPDTDIEKTRRIDLGHDQERTRRIDLGHDQERTRRIDLAADAGRTRRIDVGVDPDRTRRIDAGAVPEPPGRSSADDSQETERTRRFDRPRRGSTSRPGPSAVGGDADASPTSKIDMSRVQPRTEDGERTRRIDPRGSRAASADSDARPWFGISTDDTTVAAGKSAAGGTRAARAQTTDDATASTATGGEAAPADATTLAVPGSGPTGESASSAPTTAPADGDAVFVPANETEAALLAAATGGQTELFLSTLLLARVLIPVPENTPPDVRLDDSHFPWRREEVEGQPYLVVFTSPERMVEFLGGDAIAISAKFIQLIHVWPEVKWAFAVNPGTPVGAMLPGIQIKALAAWADDVGLTDDEGFGKHGETQPQPPAADATIVMQKPIASSQVDYYLDRGYDRVSGFVHRATEVMHLQTPAEMITSLGLTYSNSPFRRDATEVYVLRWPVYRKDLYRIPYGGQTETAMRAMQGWMIERAPFRGNGFAPGEDGKVISEFKVDSIRLPHGTQMWRLTSAGRKTLIAMLDADECLWRPVRGVDNEALWDPEMPVVVPTPSVEPPKAPSAPAARRAAATDPVDDPLDPRWRGAARRRTSGSRGTGADGSPSGRARTGER